MGELIISFMGPAPGEFLERKALDVIGTYLTSSPVAPLNKEYVEIESPLWSVGFHFFTVEGNSDIFSLVHASTLARTRAPPSAILLFTLVPFLLNTWILLIPDSELVWNALSRTVSIWKEWQWS